MRIRNFRVVYRTRFGSLRCKRTDAGRGQKVRILALSLRALPLSLSFSLCISPSFSLFLSRVFPTDSDTVPCDNIKKPQRRDFVRFLNGLSISVWRKIVKKRLQEGICKQN